MTNITHIIDRAPRQDIDIWTEEKIHLVNTQTAENAGEGRSEWEEKQVKLSDTETDTEAIYLLET